MESLTSKEFFEKLKTDNLKPAFALVGIIKRSDNNAVGIIKKTENNNEVMFAGKGNFSHWTAIPESMIESVKILKNISCKETNYTLVKLYLHVPTNPEAKIFFDLLTTLMPGEMHHEGSYGMGKSMHESEHGHCGEQHSCNEGRSNKESHFGGCGCMNCGCRRHDGCRCGCGCDTERQHMCH